MSNTVVKDFKVKHGLVVADGGIFGGTVTVATPTDLYHAATKAYVDAHAGGGGGNFTVSDTPPASPNVGDAWFDSTAARMYIYFDSFWVEASGSNGEQGTVGPQGPAGPAGESGKLPSVEVSSDLALLSDNKYFVDTTAPRTLTLPITPLVGDEIQIFDASGAANLNNVTILNNGNKINGVLDSAILDVNAFAAVFVYTGSAYGWRLG